jgi:hypothetical protein
MRTLPRAALLACSAALLCGCGAGSSPEEGLRLPPDAEEESWEIRLGGELIGTERVARGWRPGGEGVIHRERRYSMRVGGTDVDASFATRGLVDGDGALFRMEAEGESPARSWRFDPPRPHLLEESRPALRLALRGEEVVLDVFHPSTGESSEVRIRAVGGEWLDVEAPLFGARVQVDEEGRVRRVEAGALSVTTAAAPSEPGERVEVLDVLRRPTPVIEGARTSHTAVWTITGVDLAAVADFPPRQTVEGHRVRVTVPLRAEIPRDTASQVSALVRQVRERLAPAVSVGFPDAAAALRAGRGDCNEHAAVFVSLSRTAGFPARTVTGLVYLDDPLSPGLYPHAWAEVDLGEPVGWVPVDPALGQGIADATHLRLEGGLRLLDQIRVSSAEVR